MKPLILIENNVFAEDEGGKEGSIKAASKYFKVEVVEHFLKFEKKKKPVFWRGSFGLKPQLRRFHNIIENDSHFNCLEWLPALKKYALNRNYFFLDAKTISEAPESFFPVFIKPVKGDKTFAGQAFTKEKFQIEFNFFTGRGYSPFTICQISPVEKVDKEYRFIVVNNKVVGGCQYLENGERVDKEANPDAHLFATQIVLKERYLDNIFDFTIDISETNGKFNLLEINSIHTSSFYSCDLDFIYSSLVKRFEKLN